ncbi:MAG: Fur family transcriptional regulator [Candidatus Promineifilaceae bacterium]
MTQRANGRQLDDRLRAAGLRLTPQRLAIYSALVATQAHPTAQELHEQVSGRLPSLSQATVYNTLQTLVERGLVQELGDAGDGAVHYDADLSAHINLICTRCHRIQDFTEVHLPEMIDHVAECSGFHIQGARMAYYGLCPRCQAQLAAA